jgi:hypothetical protein
LKQGLVREARHNQRAHLRPRRIRKVDESPSFGCICQLRGHEIHFSLGKPRQQHVARQRHKEDSDRQVASLEPCVQPFLHEPPVLVCNAALDAFVYEVEGPIERDSHSDHPALAHLVKITGEWLQHILVHPLRQIGVELRCRWRLGRLLLLARSRLH